MLISLCHFDTVLLGDFNLDVDWTNFVAKPRVSRSSSYISLFESHEIKQFVSLYPCGSRTLEVVLSDNHQLISDVHTIHPLARSDHSIVAFSIHVSSIAKKTSISIEISLRLTSL